MEHTHTQICNHVLEEKKKLIKRFTLQQKRKSEEKPPKVLIVTYFEGDGEKAQYASNTPSSFNDCLRLTCLIDSACLSS